SATAPPTRPSGERKRIHRFAAIRCRFVHVPFRALTRVAKRWHGSCFLGTNAGASRNRRNDRLHCRQMNFASPQSVKAILGPTNTGKTYFAIERMLAHPTGMIGLPLRLLAREVYQRCVERVGEGAVALVTGEERIVPARPR